VITLYGNNPLIMELGSAYLDPGATATDLCVGAVAVLATGVVNTNAVGTNAVNYVATDGNGNTNTAIRTIIVQDTTPPTIEWSFTNLTLAANSSCMANMPDLTGTNFILAEDLSGVAAIEQSPATNTSLPLGTNVVVIAVSDPYGNTAYSTNQIVVAELTPPVIVLSGSSWTTIELGAGFTDPGATASAICSELASFTTNGTVNVGVVGTNTIVYTAADSSGNTNTAIRTVVVQDTTPPTIEWSFTNLTLAANSSCTATMPDLTGTNFILAEDLSGVAAIEQSPATNTSLSLGTNVVVIGVADPYGNTAYSTNQIVVADQTPPVIEVPPLSQTNFLGANVSFGVSATACTPLSFQWFFGLVPLVGQTNGTLVLSNITWSSIGGYDVVVSADGGAITSTVAILTVSVPPSDSIVAAQANGSVALSLSGVPGATYILEATTNLSVSANWLYLATNTLDTNGVWQFTDFQATNHSQQFYRLVLAP